MITKLESYGLAWYFAAYHTKIDSYLKRGKKGCLITIGDEPILPTYSHNSIKELFGNYQSASDVNIRTLYKNVSKQWEVYHVDAGRNELTYWKDVLPGNHILNAGRDINSISREIIKAILDSYNSNNETITITIEDKNDSDKPEMNFPLL